MGVTCQILIPRPQISFYRPGDMVYGTVRYNVDKTTDYSEIVVSLIGKGVCSWFESHMNDNRPTDEYFGKEEYVAQHIPLIRAPTTIHKGLYQFPFEFRLPENIPSSVRDKICTISYNIKAKFAKSSVFGKTKRFYAEVVVRGYVRSLTDDGAITFGAEKTLFKPFAFDHPVVNLKAQIERTIYRPGEYIKVYYLLTNKSCVDIKGIVTSLVCHTKYTSDDKMTTESNTPVKNSVVKTKCIPQSKFVKLSVVVPVSPDLYGIQNCKVMFREYILTTTLQLPIFHKNARTEIPVVVGDGYNQRCLVGGDEIAMTSHSFMSGRGNIT